MHADVGLVGLCVIWWVLQYVEADDQRQMALPLPWPPSPASVASEDVPLLQQVLQQMQQQKQQMLPMGPLAGPPSEAPAMDSLTEDCASETQRSNSKAQTAATSAKTPATFEGCLSDARIFFCGEHTSDFGQQCVHGAMHSGVRAAAECLASLFGVDVLPWTRNSWGEQQGPVVQQGPVGAATVAESGTSADQGGKGVAVGVAEASTLSGDPGPRPGCSVQADEWHTWWASSDPSYAWGPGAKETRSCPMDVALERPTPREERKRRLLQVLRLLEQQSKHSNVATPTSATPPFVVSGTS